MSSVHLRVVLSSLLSRILSSAANILSIIPRSTLSYRVYTSQGIFHTSLYNTTTSVVQLQWEDDMIILIYNTMLCHFELEKILCVDSGCIHR